LLDFVNKKKMKKISELQKTCVNLCSVMILTTLHHSKELLKKQLFHAGVAGTAGLQDFFDTKSNFDIVIFHSERFRNDASSEPFVYLLRIAFHFSLEQKF